MENTVGGTLLGETKQPDRYAACEFADRVAARLMTTDWMKA